MKSGYRSRVRNFVRPSKLQSVSANRKPRNEKEDDNASDYYNSPTLLENKLELPTLSPVKADRSKRALSAQTSKISEDLVQTEASSSNVENECKLELITPVPSEEQK